MKIKRREFVGGVVAAGAGLLAARAGVGFARSARAADSRVEVLVGEKIGTSHRDIYGHFVEHLGGVVYDGIWVGEDSSVPNVGGIRTALVDPMKRIKAPVVRWPGGCFADSYDWRDGMGPRASRPRRTNFWWTRPSGRRARRRPLEIRHQRLRHERILALLQVDRRGALFGR